MAKVTSRQTLIRYILTKLGEPVIRVNVDKTQIDDRIDDAFQYFYDYHYDAMQRLWLAIPVDQQAIDSKSVPVPEGMLYVTDILPFGSWGGGGGILPGYPFGQANLSWNFSAVSPYIATAYGTQGGVSTTQTAVGGSMVPDMVSYYLAMQSIEQLRQMGSPGPGPSYRYSRHIGRVFIDDVNWSTVEVGSFVVVGGWGAIDPDDYESIYNDRWLKRYATALVRLQWGRNLSKYSGIQLPGGVTFDGNTMVNEALAEIEKLETEMQLSYELPADPMMG